MKLGWPAREIRWLGVTAVLSAALVGLRVAGHGWAGVALFFVPEVMLLVFLCLDQPQAERIEFEDRDQDAEVGAAGQK